MQGAGHTNYSTSIMTQRLMNNLDTNNMYGMDPMEAGIAPMFSGRKGLTQIIKNGHHLANTFKIFFLYDFFFHPNSTECEGSIQW